MEVVVSITSHVHQPLCTLAPASLSTAETPKRCFPPPFALYQPPLIGEHARASVVQPTLPVALVSAPAALEAELVVLRQVLRVRGRGRVGERALAVAEALHPVAAVLAAARTRTAGSVSGVDTPTTTVTPSAPNKS
jgi:hypothetical protein